jgi:NAD(P)-dependent dehydrogenase (short-subunit alcohol dehydrogenase family)
MAAFRDQVAVISGAGRGMGRAHTLKLARDGAAVVLANIARNAVRSIEHSLADEEGLSTTAEMVRKLGSRVLALTGLLSIAPMWEIIDEQWDDVVDVNLKGMWHAVKAVAPAMIHQRSGAIVLISSTNGIEPRKRFAHYTAAEHGVLGLMKAAALELAPYNIRCNAVCPGGRARWT